MKGIKNHAQHYRNLLQCIYGNTNNISYIPIQQGHSRKHQRIKNRPSETPQTF